MRSRRHLPPAESHHIGAASESFFEKLRAEFQRHREPASLFCEFLDVPLIMNLFNFHAISRQAIQQKAIDVNFFAYSNTNGDKIF